MATGLSAKKAQKKDGVTDAEPAKRNVFNIPLFNAGAMGLLKAYKLAPENAETNNSVELAQAIAEWTDYLNKPSVDAAFDNAVDAINEFEAWLIKVNWYYSEPVIFDLNSITVQLTMQAGSGSISVSAQVTPKPDVELSVVIASVKLKLQTAVAEAFPRQAVMPPKEYAVEKAKQEKVKTEAFNVSAIVVGSFNGQRTVRIIPTNGRWQQHGVPLYDDIAETLDFEIPEEEGEYEFKGRMTYEMKPNDRPSRVVSLKGNYVE